MHVTRACVTLSTGRAARLAVVRCADSEHVLGDCRAQSRANQVADTVVVGALCGVAQLFKRLCGH